MTLSAKIGYFLPQEREIYNRAGGQDKHIIQLNNKTMQ